MTTLLNLWLIMKVRTREKWTKGLALTNNTNDLRFFLFETDFNKFSVARWEYKINYDRICRTYDDYRLDWLVHRSGNGHHWYSVTLIDKEIWKEIFRELKDINPRCPQRCLRWKPNKYVNEKSVWFNHNHRSDIDNRFWNSVELSNLLNQQFNTDFIGQVHTDLKLVNYDLR